MSFFEKRNDLDELIHIPTKADERSMVQVSFMTQDQTSRQAQSEIRAKIYSTVFLKSANPLDLRQNPQSVHFSSPNPSIRKPIHPLLLGLGCQQVHERGHQQQLGVSRVHTELDMCNA